MTAWLFDHPIAVLAMLWLPVLLLTAVAFAAIVRRVRADCTPPPFVQSSHVRPIDRFPRPTFFDFEAHA